MSNVKLAVRVRPFTEKELKSEKDKIPVVTILDENTVTITNVKVSTSGAGDSRERVRRYFADFTFDSSCSPSLQNYASQEKVYESIGREVLSCLSRGSSACVLAYGQSATGKTHTMMGTETQPGLVPRLCRAIAEDAGFEVTVSFLEIYNERVHDLLAGEDAPATCHSLPRRRGNARKDLRVREHPSRGPYVQNLRRVSVRSVEALLSLVNEGARRRRTAATRRNSTSSRSHALLELVTLRATLHLADLAGSEKASWEGCGGGRQKEGANINKSLVALSNVISALVNSRGGRGRFVPYRDSALTWLLKDCFTGGASTFIIATVSPSVACYGESASTLRWAARARQLPTQRVVHSALNNTRAALQAQFNQLLAELARHHIRYIHETGNIAYDDKHWTLEMKKNDTQRQDTPNSISRNIMNANNLRGNAKSTSTSSSVASGSSEVIYTMDTNVNPEVNQEVEDLFGPALERTRSGIDLKTTVSLKDKRQYRSQEVLPIDKISVVRQNNISDLFQKHTDLVPEKNNVSNTAPVTVVFDNQRAEIVASVTERLYSKMKKKEEAAVSKIESIVDKKLVEPLSELKICTNARQRLMDLSQKAMRHKRRIGIPAHTQTRKSVVRMRETGTDIQSDLEPYVIKDRDMYTLYRDVGTETMMTTPRLKEKAVGPCGSLDFRDKCTATKSVTCVNSIVMTDIVTKCNRYTQTPILPPPRRKRRASLFNDYKRSFNDYYARDASPENFNVSPVISINISQTYAGDSDSQSSDTSPTNVVNESTPTMMMTPDLLTNHGNIDSVIEKNDGTNQRAQNIQEDTTPVFQKDYEDFSDSDDSLLPRVTANISRKEDHQEIKRLILGRNEKTYPYNIVISPFKEINQINQSEKLVKFKGYDTAPPCIKSVQVDSKNGNNQDKKSIKDLSTDGCSLDTDCNRYKKSQGSTCSDSIASSKSDTDSFIWKKGGIIYKPNNGDCYRCQTPSYNSKYISTKRRIYKEFLGLNCYEVQCSNCSETSNNFSSSDSTEVSQSSLNRFRERRRFFENQNYCNGTDKYDTLEKKILHSCDRLEAAVNNYEDRSLDHLNNRVSLSTPKKYLQHLVQLRREVIKANSDSI